MKLLLTTKIDKKNVLKFGIPTNKIEREKIFKLRYTVYILEKGYRESKATVKKQEYDKYDRKVRTQYFMALLGKKLVGTIRLVVGRPLPVMEDYFEFQEPKETKKFSSNQIAEISRAISRPRGAALPRHIVSLGLFFCLLQWSSKHNIKVEYEVVKKDLAIKLKKINLPLHKIKNFSLKNTPLTREYSGYFKKNTNNLFIFYFFTRKVQNQLEKILSKMQYLKIT